MLLFRCFLHTFHHRIRSFAFTCFSLSFDAYGKRCARKPIKKREEKKNLCLLHVLKQLHKGKCIRPVVNKCDKLISISEKFHGKRNEKKKSRLNDAEMLESLKKTIWIHDNCLKKKKLPINNSVELHSQTNQKGLYSHFSFRLINLSIYI